MLDFLRMFIRSSRVLMFRERKGVSLSMYVAVVSPFIDVQR